MSTPPTPPDTTEVRSAPTLGQLFPEERKKRYAELRAAMRRSKIEVVGDPSKHYFWADKNDDRELIKFDLLGYKVVKEQDLKHPKIKAAGLKPDGTYQIGDVILLECPMDVYEFLMLEMENEANSLVINAKENFKQEAEKVGAPTFEVNAKTGKRV